MKAMLEKNKKLYIIYTYMLKGLFHLYFSASVAVSRVNLVLNMFYESNYQDQILKLKKGGFRVLW